MNFVLIGETQSYLLKEGRNLIGRSSMARIRLTGPYHSMMHAVIHHNRRSTVLIDHSKNGTCVNRKRVASKELRNGDQIDFGNAVFKLMMIPTTDTIIISDEEDSGCIVISDEEEDEKWDGRTSQTRPVSPGQWHPVPRNTIK